MVNNLNKCIPLTPNSSPVTMPPPQSSSSSLASDLLNNNDHSTNELNPNETDKELI